MARKLRVQYPGAIYHVMSRGDHQEIIFRDDQDRELFLASLSEASARTDWQVHVFCLMSDHFHIVIETPRGNLVEGMKWLLGTYTSRFNRKHKLFGQMTTLVRPKFGGPEWQETNQKKAERIVREELSRRGWEPKRLEQLAKADPEKLKIAKQLRAQTCVSLRWIADHLSMGAPAYLGNRLRTAKP